jgi:hypothetical protein
MENTTYPTSKFRFIYKQQAIVKLADGNPSLYNNIFEKRVGDTAIMR